MSVCESRAMHASALKAWQKTRFNRTTESNSTHGALVAANVRNQGFRCDRPDQKLGADIRYIWPNAGWLYLAISVDLYSRRSIDWRH